MEIMKISKKEYNQLMKYKFAYFAILETVKKNEPDYEFDLEYVHKLNKQAIKEYKSGKGIIAKSVEEALSIYDRK
jgi:hypothetical protein